MKKVCANIRSMIHRNRIRIICTGVVLTLLILFLWPSIVISIKPGELGVLYSRFNGGTQLQRTYDEGIHFIQPWNIMYIYDVRLQEETQNIDVLTVDGLTINVQISLRFQLIRDRLPALHQDIGPYYRDKVVIPIMNSAVRQTIGSYRPDDLYSTARQELQDQMMVDAVEEMGRIPILIQGFVVKSITLPEVLRGAIERKLVAEQDFLRYKYILLEAQQEARRKAIEGEGIKAYQGLVNANMTQNFLRYEGIQATKDLAASPNSKVIVIGGKDGLPVILNADSPTGGAAPDAANADKQANQGAASKDDQQGSSATNMRDQTGPNQSGADQSGPNMVGQNPTGPDQAGSDNSTANQNRRAPSRPDQIRPDPIRPDRARSGRVGPETGKSPAPRSESRPGSQSFFAARPRQTAPMRDSAESAASPTPSGVSWIAPGESISDFIQRLDKSLLQPHRGGAIRQ